MLAEQRGYPSSAARLSVLCVVMVLFAGAQRIGR